jgi:hypothetical protein
MTLGREWAAIELVAQAPLSPEASEILADFLSRDVQWGDLLEQALRHKLLPLLATQVADEPYRRILPWHIRNHLGATLCHNRQRIQVYRTAAVEIAGALARADVRFVATKGITFESTLYGGTGARYMNDLDFMILPLDRSRVIDIMHGLGYEMGSLEPESSEIMPHSRREKIVYQLNPDHVPIMTRLTDDPATPAVRVDFANSLTWTNSPFDVPVDDALADAQVQSVPGHSVVLPVFSPYYQFIFTALHLFREAWIERWLDEGQDVNLVKFADMLRLWRAHQESLRQPEFRAILERFEIMDPISWVVEHLDRVMGSNVAAALGLRGRVSAEWLASAYESGGGTRRWHGTMRERLWAKDRRDLFTTAYRRDS